MLILKKSCKSCLILEVHLERKLDHARSGTRRRDASKRRRHGDVVVRVREVGPVENIEKLRAKLAAHPLRDRNELDHREVHVLLSRTIQEVARRVSKRVVQIEVWIVRST